MCVRERVCVCQKERESVCVRETERVFGEVPSGRRMARVAADVASKFVSFLPKSPEGCRRRILILAEIDLCLSERVCVSQIESE